MIRALAAAVATAIVGGSPAAAQTVAIGLSADAVTITSNFSGASVTVFGSILGADPAAAWADYDLVVLLRGPDGTVVARRKDRVLGLWINRGAVEFAEVPEFYGLNTTRPLDAVAAPALLAGLGLGLENLGLTPDAGVPPAEAAAFAEALIRLRAERQHYVVEEGAVENLGGLLFRTAFALPADVPVGEYSATVHVFREGAVVAAAERPLVISKSSAEQFVFDASRESSLAYALVVIAMGAGVGWLAGVIFRRD